MSLTSLQAPLLDGALTLPKIVHIGARIAAAEPDGAPTQRIAIAGAVTLDNLRCAIACGVMAEGVWPIMHQAPFGSYVQEVLDPASGLHAFAPELVVLAPTWRELLAPLPIGASADAVDAALDVQVALFRRLWTTLAERNVRIIQHLLVAPQNRYRGPAERVAAASPANQVWRLNDMLMQAGRGLVHFLDLDALASEIGSRHWAAARFHYMAKLDFDQRWLPDYVPLFRSAWRSANARAKKLLALDLDNTLWGGVIGDDGVEGIALGPGSAEGEAFEDWQRYVKGLSERGVVLAVCSKNAPEIAESGFSHPHAVLRRGDFAAFECSWNDKVGGLRRIAAALNLGLDSFVFADDNAAECELVRQALPEVAVVHLGDDPAQFVEIFDAGRWLDVSEYTEDDMARVAAYGARAAALAEQEQATDINTYLVGLAMRGRLFVPGENDIARVAQLEQKTNQFNLTTRRHSEAAIRALLARDDAIVLALRLSDRFGDHGLVATLIALHEGDALRIDSWLMSCRVFSRSAEQFMLRGLIRLAAARGARRLLGEYRPTAKNAVVAELYPRLGFMPEADALFTRDVGAGVDDLVTQITAVDGEVAE